MLAISVEKVKERTNQKPAFSTSPPPTTPLLRTNTGLVCSNKKRLDHNTLLALKLNDRKLFNSFNNAFNIKKKNIIKTNKTLPSTRKPNQPNRRKPEPSVKSQIKTILESTRSKNATKNIRSPVKSPPETHVSNQQRPDTNQQRPDTELLSARQEYLNLELTSLKNMLSKQQELYKEMLNDRAESKNKDRDADNKDSTGQVLPNGAEQLLVDEKEGIIEETKNEILIIQEPAPPEKQQTTPPKKVKFSTSTSPQPLDTSILLYQNNKENANPINYDTMLQNLTELLMTQITPFLAPASLAASTKVNIQKIQHKKEEFNDDQVLIIGQESVTENIGTEIVVGKDETTYGAIVSPQSPIVIHKPSVKPRVISPKLVEEKDEEYLGLWLPTSIISNIRSSRSAQLAFQRQVFNVDDDDVIEMKAVDQLLEDGIWDILDSVAKYVVHGTVDTVTNELCEFVDDYVDGLVSSELK